MPLIPLQIPAGQYRNGTEYMSQGRWRDINLVRWHEDALRPIGGWRQRGSIDLSGVVRSMISWEQNDGTRQIAAGTYNKLYAINANNTATDITPTGLTAGSVDASINTAYSGGFYDGHFHGEGKMMFANRDRYMGAFANDTYHGHGVFISKQGEVFSGLWDHGTLMADDGPQDNFY